MDAGCCAPVAGTVLARRAKAWATVSERVGLGDGQVSPSLQSIISGASGCFGNELA